MSNDPTDLIAHSLEAVVERAGDPAPTIFARLFAELPETRERLARDASGAVRGEMLAMVFDCLMPPEGHTGPKCRHFAVNLTAPSPQLQKRRIVQGVPRALALMQAGDRGTGTAVARIVEALGPEEPQRQGPAALAAMRWRAAVQSARVEDHQVARLGRERDDVELATLRLDVGQPWQGRLRVQRRGVVAQLEARAVIELANWPGSPHRR